MHPTTWTLDDALALRCRVEDVGCLRPALQVLDAAQAPLPGTKERMAAFALANLCRIAQGDDRAAVDACRELLSRCAPPPEQATGANDPASWPDWLTSRRLAYQEGAAHEGGERAPVVQATRDDVMPRQH